jgi:hypothetical protein
MVRTALAQCAAALKETPVELIQDYTPSPDTDSPSTPIDQPIFQLSRDCEYNKASEYEDLSSTFRDQYTNHTVFKFAVQAHSKSGQT